MRFSRLSLHKYGQFEECDLHFPPREMDFHLVFGSNEAGKSTTLSAAGDLLFGFPHGKAYDFRFPAGLLRVGGVLEDAEASLAVRRRRGNQDTLEDEAGRPVPEARLQAMLQGRSAAEFQTHFGLDHARLRDGGRAMTDARGDLAQTVFAAGSGMLGAQTLLRTLQVEADAIWSPSRSSASCRQAARAFKEAEAQVKAASRKPKAWAAGRDLRDTLAEAKATLEAERAALQADLRRLERQRALAMPVQQRAALVQQIAASAAPPFDPAQERLYDETERSITEASLKLLAAEAATLEAEAGRAAIAVDRTVLAQREAIEALVTTAGAAREAERDLPGIEAELQDEQTVCDRLIRDLGLPPGPPDAALERLPSPVVLQRLQELLRQRQSLDTLLKELREKARLDRLAREAAQTELRALAAPAMTRAETLALQHGRATAAIADRLGERLRTAASAARTLQNALRKLAPWTGNADTLATLSAPAEDDVKSSETAMLAASKAVEDERRVLQARSDARDRLTLERAELASSRRAVAFAELAALRERRRAAWSPLLAHVIDGAALPDAPGAVAAFEAAVQAADSLADERYETAAASARLTELGIGIKLAEQDTAQARQRLGTALAALEAGQLAWGALLEASDLPAMTHGAARQWRADAAGALRQAELLAQADGARADDEARVASARAGLAAVLVQHGVPADETAPFSAVLDHVQSLVDEAAKAAQGRSRLEARLKSAEQSLAASEKRLAELAEQSAAWTQSWADVCRQSGSGIPASAMPAHLPLFEPLRGRLQAATTLMGRIAGIARRRLRFEADSLALAAACCVVERSLDPQAITEQLRLRLVRALSDSRAADELDRTLQRKGEASQDARRGIEAAEHLRQPLMATAGTTDRAGLAAAMQAWREARELRARLRQLEDSIRVIGEDYSIDRLVAEAEAADPAWLGPETARLQAAIVDLDERIGKAALAAGEANHAFEALDVGSSEAALAATEQEHARAALQAEAEAYLMKRAQAVILARAVEDYRKRHENPLLSQAGPLFRQLTLGRYARLDIDRSGKAPLLVGIGADGKSQVPVEGMSDGTADQLFLSLRLARLGQFLDAGTTLPFLADDLFINFDDRRAHAGFRVLGEMARRTQVLFFTHHDHLRAIAQDALGPHTVSVCELAAA